jgi:quinoprotein glucose dehydrogenase
LWDFDPAAAPVLFEAQRNNRIVLGVAQITKTGLLFAFERSTGAPIYGMEERPVPQTTVPGEWTSPTQPFPVKPPPLSRVRFTEEDLYDRTPEHAEFCRDLYERNQMKPVELYTPFPMEQNVLMFPSTLGGGGWGGVVWEPDQGLLITNVNNIGQWGHMEKRPEGESGTPYRRTSEYGAYARFWNVENKIPCTNPPFGELVAVDTATGEIAWRSPLGTVPELEAQGVTDSGAPNLGGGIATAGGLFFIAATNDSRFRAFDSKTGDLVWERPIDANGHTIPVTYLGKDGKQYVALMAGGGGGYFGGSPADTLIAFVLGEEGAEAETVTVASPVERQPIVLPDSTAKAVLTSTCGTTCHGLETVTVFRRTRAGWNAMIDTMVSRGATLSSEQRVVILDYLSEFAAE